MATTITPNMSLPLPIVGVEPGPAYGTDQNAAFTILDSHNHSAGSGVQITPSGLNINSTLTFNTQAATNLLSAGFTSQIAALSGTNFISFVGGNFYVNDGSGNQIQITSAGGVAGSPGSIGSLASPAAATYSAGSKTFIWTAASGKAAAMDNGAVTIRETNVSSANGITLASPTALAANYQLTLPAALPASTLSLGVNTSGVTSYLTGNQIAATVTRATGSSTEGAGGVPVSASSSNFWTSTSSYTDVTNLSVTLTTSGRPVMLIITSDGSTGSAFTLLGTSPGGGNLSANIQFLRDGGVIANTGFSYPIPMPNSAGIGINFPAIWSYIDTGVTAGTHTFKVQGRHVTAGGVTGPIFQVGFCILQAFEL